MVDETPVAKRRSSLLWWWIKRASIGLAALVILGVSLLGVAEHRTSQPGFCGSCHIMEPYYETWQADIHGTKLGVACVDCHYAPGERTTVNAKLRGLSQVASYFSERYGATRPRAHVSNDSCLTSKCHGDLKFMDQEIWLGTVKFRHAVHLRPSKEKQEAAAKELAELSQTLLDALGEGAFRQLTELARESGAAKPRIDRMQKLVSASDAAIRESDLERFSQLQHRGVRVAQLADLQCTSCHMYSSRDSRSRDVTPEHHFSVSTTSCYTCHFNNEGFNTGTNRCLLCHTLPTTEITVHEQLNPQESKQLESADLITRPLTMDHQSIIERNVDCIACHADVASEDSSVTRRDCEHCHDQPRFFEDWKEPMTVDLVTRYHEVHVPRQRAKCLDCHSEIHHQLIGEDANGAEQPGFLSAVMANCTHCHPNQHSEQVNLLRGSGGIGVPNSTPNMMFGARTNCYGCHTEAVMDELGYEVVKATESGCVACHGDHHTETFEKWKMSIELLLSDAQQAYQNARQLLEESSDVTPEARQKATALLAVAKADLNLVQRGNGLHNVTYAIDLLDSVTQRCQEAVELLSEAESVSQQSDEME